MRKILSFSLLAFLLLIGTNSYGIDVTATLTGSALSVGADDAYTVHDTPLEDDKGNEYVGRWYNAKASGTWYNMIQLKAYESSSTADGSARIVLPKFDGNIKSITLAVTGASATSKNQSGKKAKTKMYVVNSSAYDKTTAESKKILEADHSTTETSTFSVVFDFSTLGTSYDGDGLWICSASGSVRVWEVVVVYTVNTIPVEIDPTYGWATYSSPYKLDFTGKNVKAYIVNGVLTGNVLDLTRVYKVPANTGLLISGATDNIPLTTADPDEGPDFAGEKMIAGQGKSVSSESGYDKYVLSVENSKAVFKLISGTPATVNKKKAYLKLTAGSVSAPSIIRLVDEESNATNIEAIDAAENAVKFFENGRLLIKKGDVVYDALGRVVR